MDYPQNRRILFLDINSFFTSCEQADQPALVGQPVIVVPTEGSCALSASYEAKRRGIRTGTLEREARLLAPGLVVVRARPKRYMAYHDQLVKVLTSLSPRVTMRSVDEGSIQLCRNEEPWSLARSIKNAIWQQLSPAIHCSIGIGPNVALAKLGTELQKPNGLVEIRLEALESTYERVKLRDLTGINVAMERQFNRLGIYSVLELYRHDPLWLRQNLGLVGYRFWLRLHGYEVGSEASPRRSLSHSHVLPPQYRSPEAAYKTVQRLGAKVGRRLRRDGYLAGRISLVIRFVDGQVFAHSIKVTPVADSISLIRIIQKLWQLAKPSSPILKLAVWTNELVPSASVPLPLFASDRKRRSLAQALDTINDRYGTDTVRFATLDSQGSSAPDRISFNALFTIEHE